MSLSPLLQPRSNGVPKPLFSIEAAQRGDDFVIRLEGELDLSVRHRLDRAFAASEASGVRTVWVDLDELTFIDASGLDSLVTATQRSAESEAELRMTPGTGDVAAIFQLTSLDQLLPLEPA